MRAGVSISHTLRSSVLLTFAVNPNRLLTNEGVELAAYDVMQAGPRARLVNARRHLVDQCAG